MAEGKEEKFDKRIAGVVQRLEHRLHKTGVVSSSLTPGTGQFMRA